LIEQDLGVVVAVHELQRSDLLSEVWQAGESAQLTEVPQGHLVAPLVAGGLAGGLYRHAERFPVAAVAGLLDHAGLIIAAYPGRPHGPRFIARRTSEPRCLT
jgi:hypothetical protein